MKLTKEVLEDFVSLSLGDDILPLIDILWSKKNVSEFKLAENLNITVNQVRNMLYRLGEYNLVMSTRKKDKRKGWYIYYWSLNEKSTFNAIWRFKQKKLQEFKDRVNREKDGIFYVCPSGCVRLGIDNAMDQDFHCTECGSLLMQQDNQKTIANLQKQIISLGLEVEEYNKVALEIIEERKKKSIREETRIKRARDKEQKKAREERAATRKAIKDALPPKEKKVKKKKKAKKKAKKKVKKKIAKKSKKKVTKKIPKVTKKVEKKSKKKPAKKVIKKVLKKILKK
ncbi:MAG: hypothetical protein ISS01_01315 [Nanoarchaeota archaeon]|nr:hypothetical protein [Nanoarchaeota archaeon]